MSSERLFTGLMSDSTMGSLTFILLISSYFFWEDFLIQLIKYFSLHLIFFLILLGMRRGKRSTQES